MKLGLYYSLWDRKVNADVDNVESDRKYNTYMLKQLDELMDITEKYTKIVGKIEKKCRKGLDFKVYLNDTLIPEGNIREDIQDGKSKKSNPFRQALCDRPDPAVLHRPDPGSWKNAPAMNGWKHTTI